jgi:4,5-DOPA dioxygenase extradiol
MTHMPVLFVGHGSPMQAIEPNRHTALWAQLGRELPRPRAILCVSAHWYTRGTAVTTAARPRTIHDFYGFPAELYRCQYPAPGSPDLAARVQTLLAPDTVHGVDDDWGLDHGSWSVLLYMYPEADVPVVQLSIDGSRPAADHYDLGRRLAPLRNEDVLILGSGNVVHNLRAMQRDAAAPAAALAIEFNDAVRGAVLARDHAMLIDYPRLGRAAAFSVPTPDHYLPLLYVLGAGTDADSITLPADGIDLGSISMLSVLLDVGRAPTLQDRQ